MLFVIDTDGRTEFTRSPDALSLLHPQDKKRIVRMTEIVHDDDLQRYYVRFLTGIYAKGGWDLLTILVPRYDEFAHEYGGFEDEFQIHTERGGLITFDSYEAAVRAEVRFVDFIREVVGASMQ